MVKKNLVSLGIDLGSRNTMLAVAHPKRGFGETKHFQSPIRALVDKPKLSLMRSIKVFIKEFGSDLDRIKPGRVTAERFLTRGFRGAGIEMINFMLGMMAAECFHRGIKFQAITASTWKNAINRRFNNKEALRTVYKGFKIKERHYVDAFLIAHFRFDKKFTKLKSIDDIVKKIQVRIKKAQS